MKLLTFAELADGETFVFLWEQGESEIATKTGPRTFELGAFAGRVGVGDNPVRRVPCPARTDGGPCTPFTTDGMTCEWCGRGLRG